MKILNKGILNENTPEKCIFKAYGGGVKSRGAQSHLPKLPQSLTHELGRKLMLERFLKVQFKTAFFL